MSAEIARVEIVSAEIVSPAGMVVLRGKGLAPRGAVVLRSRSRAVDLQRIGRYVPARGRMPVVTGHFVVISGPGIASSLILGVPLRMFGSRVGIALQRAALLAKDETIVIGSRTGRVRSREGGARIGSGLPAIVEMKPRRALADSEAI